MFSGVFRPPGLFYAPGLFWPPLHKQQDMWYTSNMQIVLIILSVGLLGLIIFFAVSPKSSRLLKIAAFIALGLIGLSIGVAGVFLIIGPAESPDHIPFPVFPEAQPQAPKAGGNMAAIVIFLLFFSLIMGLTIVLTLREQRRKDKKIKKGKEAPVFHVDEELNIGEPQVKMEDSFDLEDIEDIGSE